MSASIYSVVQQIGVHNLIGSPPGKARGRRRGQGQCQTTGPAVAGLTDGAGPVSCRVEHLLGHLTEDDVIHYS